MELGLIIEAAADLADVHNAAFGTKGTHLPTIAPNMCLTVLAIQIALTCVLAIAAKGKLGYSEES